VTRQLLDRSSLQGECIELFRAAMKSPYTRDPYERRLINFLYHVNLTPDEFVTLGRKEPLVVEKKVMSFIATQKARIEKKEITGATISNFLRRDSCRGNIHEYPNPLQLLELTYLSTVIVALIFIYLDSYNRITKAKATHLRLTLCNLK
jgi:hypothetical protein